MSIIINMNEQVGNNLKKVPPGIEAIEKLEDFVKVNRLKADTKIPCEKDLCEMWNISRSTLRQAVDCLVEEGVLYRIKDKGIYVNQKKYERDMAGVDAMVRDLINQGNKVSKKIISINIVEASKQLSRKMDIKLGTKVYEIVRIRVINNDPCTIETAYINSEKYINFTDYYSETASLDDIFVNKFDAIQTTGYEHINVTYASESEAKVLKIKKSSPLFYASGISKDQNDDVVMYYKQLIRPDKFNFVCTVESRG